MKGLPSHAAPLYSEMTEPGMSFMMAACRQRTIEAGLPCSTIHAIDGRH